MSVGLFNPALTPIFDPITQDLRDLDENLVAVFNRENMQYEIYDRAAPGGPKWQLVMRIPRGRRLDQRAITDLRQARNRTWAEYITEIERQEDADDKERRRRIHNDTAGMADDLKYIDRHITPSVADRDRLRESIRREAKQ